MSGFADFVRLLTSLDQTTSTKAKEASIASYLQRASDADLSWAMFILTGRRLRRPVSPRSLRDWAAAHTGLAPWLIEECYHTVGDLSETLSILCSRGEAGARPNGSLSDFMEGVVAPLAEATEAEQKHLVTRWWQEYDEATCFAAHKLVGGSLRVGVSATLAARALAAALGLAPATVEHRLMGNWAPGAEAGARLRCPNDQESDRARPYPFYLASSLTGDARELGNVREWLAEWKWDGIRAQLVVRGGEAYLWSRGEELITERFPEVIAAARALPNGTVIDGEIVAMRDGVVLPFASLQTRIGRTNLSTRVLRDIPAVLVAFDLLESGGVDQRNVSLDRRRALLEAVVSGGASALQCSERISESTWQGLEARRAESRARGVEGLMLKRRESPYRVGRPKGDWWKWKIEPFTMDAVLVYAQAGHGKRAALFTDYTFAVWHGDELVPVAKAYSGLDNAEIVRLDRWIRANTLERHGPLRVVQPHHVFELAFERIQASGRHKAGFAVRFPRIIRWRADKGPRDASTVDDLKQFVAVPRASPSHTARDAPLSLFSDEQS